MIRFTVYNQGKLADRVDLAGSYVLGSDGVPIRAEVEFKGGEIRCRKRVAGPAGLAILWPVQDMGRILLETARVPEREKPYILQVELARGRLMRIAQKREDWSQDNGEWAGGDALTHRVEESRDLLISALQSEHPAEAARLADQSLSKAVTAGEELSRINSGSLLERRRPLGGGNRRFFGGAIDLNNPTEAYLKRLVGAFDFVSVPFSWRMVEPAEQQLDWKALDTWVEWLAKHRVPMKGYDLVSFTERNVPDWVSFYEHDFETIRDLVYEHIRRVINRYGSHIQVWDAVSGIHGTNCLSFSFEELLELTRMCSAIVKQAAPRSTVLIDMVAPWGEYYARNHRTIPPLLYADMLLQSGINFDAFGLRLRFGSGRDGMFLRDMFQISSMLDRFNLGKPLHVTAVGVPSSGKSEGSDSASSRTDGQEGGEWYGPWSESLQARWLKEFYALALSKPFIDTVTWHPLCDREVHDLPHCGLLRSNVTPKPAYDELLKLRATLKARS